jgi:transmembrane sensor
MLKIDEELIVKYLDGEASPDEAIAIDDWRNASSENNKLFEQIEQSVTLFNRGEKFKTPDVLQEWLKIKEQTIDRREQKKKTIFLTPFRIAASLVLIAIAGYLVTLMLSKTTGPTSEPGWLTKNSAAEILETKLADQSKITLYRNSIVSYPEKFDKKVREVRLVEGEAYFDVTHNPEQPFVVDVKEIQVKVLGTSFNIQSAQELNTIEIQVTRGSVMIYNDFGSEIVNAGQVGTYDRKTKLFNVTTNNVSKLNTVGYATQSFDFTDVTLEEVTAHLSKTFNVTFNFKNEKLKNCRMNGEFKNRSLDFILKVISATFEIECTKEGNVIELSGNACD